ncbi:MAG: undecaprenyl-phosphate glucose phosphotransferase [Thiotrichales bacterium]|nr:MAG: undecaprenyl-phosphate glucose phosphotransferase [Thiotrichales bacterium]
MLNLSKPLHTNIKFFDLFIIVVSAYLALFLRFHNITTNTPNSYHLAILGGTLIAFVCFSAFGLHDLINSASVKKYIPRLLICWSMTAIIFIFCMFLLKTEVILSRVWLLLWIGIGTILSGGFHVTLMLIIKKALANGWGQKNIVIIGAGSIGKLVAEKLLHTAYPKYKIKNFFDRNAKLQKSSIHNINIIPLPENLYAYLKENNIAEVWLAIPLEKMHTLKDTLKLLRFSTATLRLIPDIFELELLNYSISKIDDIPVLNLRTTPMHGRNRLVKSIEDKLLSSIILVCISPVLAGIAILIKLTSKGPVLFKQLRYGVDGESIKIYKFRSMFVHKETDNKVTQASKNDSRITGVGKFLRKTSLDELPQFFNVIQGNMSIVGPRPHAVAHNETYKKLIPQYMHRHIVKPGITGWAQINGFRGETKTLDKMQKRIDYDLHYIENWSLLLDLKIILITVFKGFISKNAR